MIGSRSALVRVIIPSRDTRDNSSHPAKGGSTQRLSSELDLHNILCRRRLRASHSVEICDRPVGSILKKPPHPCGTPVALLANNPRRNPQDVKGRRHTGDRD